MHSVYQISVEQQNCACPRPRTVLEYVGKRGWGMEGYWCCRTWVQCSPCIGGAKCGLIASNERDDVFVQLCVYTHVYVYVYAYLCIDCGSQCVWTVSCMRVCVRVHMYAYAYVCRCIYMCIFLQ